jgi:signal transduction histidine kinase
MLISNLHKIDHFLHDISTPVTVLLLNLELVLKSRPLSKYQHDHLKRALGATLKIRKLINNYKN